MGEWDKQLIFFMIQNVFIGVCGLIDTGFGNRMGIDEVCVLSSYTIITWATFQLYQMGCWAYTVMLEKAKLCMIVQIVVSIIVGTVIYITASDIAHLYSLTGTQYNMLEQCLKIHGLSCPISAIRAFLSAYAQYGCHNKKALIGNIILYGTMIITDIYVVVNKRGIYSLVACTTLCYLIYTVYMFIVLPFKKETMNLEKGDIRRIIKYGLDTVISKISAKIATIVFNVYASKLGTMSYSIHSVCYAIGLFTENITVALQSYLIVKIKEISNKSDKLQKCKDIVRGYGIQLIIIAYITGLILLLFTHGKVQLRYCIGYTFLYCTQAFAQIVRHSATAYMISEHKTKYLKREGMVGIIVRIPVVMIAYYSGIGLPLFALASTIDFGVRGMICYRWDKRDSLMG